MPTTLPRTLCSLSSLIVLAMFSTVACGDSPTAPSGSGNLVVQLTDDHTDNVEQVNIYFTSVTANSTGAPPETMTLVLSENPQDLLLLRDAVIPLATAVVEPGDYVSLRINLDADQSSVVEGGKTLPLQIPSGEIKILGTPPDLTPQTRRQPATVTDWPTPSLGSEHPPAGSSSHSFLRGRRTRR